MSRLIQYKTHPFLTVLVALLSLTLAISQAQSAEIDVKGMGRGINEELATAAALQDALTRHVAAMNPAKARMFSAVEEQIRQNIANYFLTHQEISKAIEGKEVVVVLRAAVDTNKLDSAMGASGPGVRGPASGGGSARKISLSYLFVARKAVAVKSFDTRRTQVQKSDMNASESSNFQAGSVSESRMDSVTTGGNTVVQADQSEYAVSSPDDMNAATLQIFSDNGFDVYDYADVSAECSGIAPEKLYAVFKTEQTLPRDLRKAAFDAARSCSVNTFAMGTLDVGIKQMDPVSGMVQVSVSVNSQVFDINSRLPKVIASVGPTHYSGLGPDETVATRNALTKSAQEAANAISDQLKSKGIN